MTFRERLLNSEAARITMDCSEFIASAKELNRRMNEQMANVDDALGNRGDQSITITFNLSNESKSEIVRRFREELEKTINPNTMTHKQRRERKQEIMVAYLNGEGTYEELAVRFDVAVSTVKNFAASARYRRSRGMM